MPLLHSFIITKCISFTKVAMFSLFFFFLHQGENLGLKKKKTVISAARKKGIKIGSFLFFFFFFLRSREEISRFEKFHIGRYLC